MNKVAVFIASGSGMGADAAKHLHSKGYEIAIMSSSGKGENLAKDLGGVGFTGSNLQPNDIKNFIYKVNNEFGKIDILVNSAGHGPKGDILEISDEDWIKGSLATKNKYEDKYTHSIKKNDDFWRKEGKRN